jgi:hypothetical protein
MEMERKEVGIFGYFIDIVGMYQTIGKNGFVPYRIQPEEIR